MGVAAYGVHSVATVGWMHVRYDMHMVGSVRGRFDLDSPLSVWSRGWRPVTHCHSAGEDKSMRWCEGQREAYPQGRRARYGTPELRGLMHWHFCEGSRISLWSFGLIGHGFCCCGNSPASVPKCHQK